MEQQIKQLLKEVKGNETLERLVKMNKNPNELFIERIRAMNKGENGNENENEYKKQKKRLLDFIDSLKRNMPDEPPIETPIETPDNQPNDPLNNQPNDPPGNQRDFSFTNSDIVGQKLKNVRNELYHN